MRKVVIPFVLMIGVLAISACNKKKQDVASDPGGEISSQSASPNDSPAIVTMTDGSRYRGTLVSKNGSQMTFRGDNGATRTIDSRDIQTIHFEDLGPAGTAPAATANDRPLPSAGSSPSTMSSPSSFPPPVRNRAVIPGGTQIAVRNNQAINSSTASPGETFSAVVASDVLDETGAVAIPRGSSATLVVREAGAGKIHANDLALELKSLAIRGVARDVQTGVLFKKGRDGVGGNKRTAVFTGGGAAVGALIGGLVGGGRGAAIGAASGAGAGAGTQIMTRGSVKIPSESVMRFTLEAPLAL